MEAVVAALAVVAVARRLRTLADNGVSTGAMAEALTVLVVLMSAAVAEGGARLAVAVAVAVPAAVRAAGSLVPFWESFWPAR